MPVKILFSVLFIVFFINIAVSQAAEVKNTVIVLPSKYIRTEGKLIELVEPVMQEKFPSDKYSSLFVYTNDGRELDAPLANFIEGVNEDSQVMEDFSLIVKKERMAEYLKATGADYLTVVAIYPAGIRISRGGFGWGNVVNINFQLDTKTFDAKTGQYTYSSSISNKETDAPRPALKKTLAAFQKNVTPPVYATP